MIKIDKRPLKGPRNENIDLARLWPNKGGVWQNFFWRWKIPLLALGALLFSQLVSYPSDVQDAFSLSFISGFQLHVPLLHVLFEPFYGLSDALTIAGLWTTIVLLLYVLFIILAFLRGWWRPAAAVGLVGFFAWSLLVPHRMSWLSAKDPNVILVDFHSHTAVSHDGRPGFSVLSNEEWHRSQGFNASFITEHNKVAPARMARQHSLATWKKTGYRNLVGEEVSLKNIHLIALGDHGQIDRRPFNSSRESVGAYMREAHRENVLLFAVLPYYWLNYWNYAPTNRVFPPLAPDFPRKSPALETLIRNGLNGFEISNGTPNGLDFTPGARRIILGLCRRYHLPAIAVTDNHGYGSATPNWNAMRLPGWQKMNPLELERAILRKLQEGGLAAVRVLERPRYRPETPLQLALSPAGFTVVYFRSLNWYQRLSWYVWIGLFSLIADRRRARRKRLEKQCEDRKRAMAADAQRKEEETVALLSR